MGDLDTNAGKARVSKKKKKVKRTHPILNDRSALEHTLSCIV